MSVGLLIFGNIKVSNFNSLKSVKNSYIIKSISPNISIDKFYSKQDEVKIINELIELSEPKKQNLQSFCGRRESFQTAI